MIGIKIGDEFLEVSKDTRISLKLVNPLFNEDNLSPGSLSLPFDLPSGENSPGNAVILGHPDVIENVEGFRKIAGSLFFDGLPMKAGKLIVREHGEGKTNTNFNFGLGTISDEFKTKKVREIIAQTITIDAGAHPKKVYLKAGALAAPDYSITVNGRVYTAATVSALATAINADVTEPRATATYVTTGTTPLGVAQPFIEIGAYTNPNDPLTPLHVDYEDDNGNSSTGYVWYVEGMDLTAYRAAFTSFMDAYNTDPYPDEAIRFPTMFNDSFSGQYGGAINLSGFYNNTLIKGSNYVNARNSYGLIFNGIGTTTPFTVRNMNSIQPFLRMKWVLDQIATYFNFEYEGDWYDTEATNMLIDHAAALDAPLDYIGKTKFVFWRRSFNLSELIEDVTVVDLLKALQSRYNLGIYTNELNGKLRLVKREAVAIAKTDEDITAKAGNIKRVSDMRLTGVKFSTPKDDTDEYSTADELSVGDAEETITSKMGSITQEFTTTISGDSGSVTGPLKRQDFGDKFKLRVFHYVGLINNGTFTYAKASKDGNGFVETWTGASGLYARRWKYWIYFAMRRRAVTLPVSFDYTDLYRIDWELKRRLDRKQFMIKSIDVELTPGGIRVSDVELYTMI